MANVIAFRRTLARLIDRIAFVAVVSAPTAFAIAPAASAEPLKVAFMIGEEEYKMNETLPAFAAKYLEPLGAKCTFINADEKNPSRFPGLEKITDADVLVLSVRRRPLPKEDMERIHTYLDSGKPLVGIRTACHAFAGRGGQAKKSDKGDELVEWPDFDVQVLGGHYTGHFKNQEGTDVSALPDATSHPILSGVSSTTFHSSGTLYKCGELNKNTHVLLNGTTKDQGNPVTMPVAWTCEDGKSRVFFTSLGHPDDFKLPEFNQLLVNAIYWAANRSATTR